MQDPNMVIVASRLKSFEDSFDELKGDMRKMAEAVTKLAVMEERQVSANQAQERSFKVIAEIQADAKVTNTRISALELAGVNSKRTSAWVDRAVTALVVVVFFFMAHKAGLT